jgi:hypothetical protein
MSAQQEHHYQPVYGQAKANPTQHPQHEAVYHSGTAHLFFLQSY